MGFRILRYHQAFKRELKFSFNSYKLYIILLGLFIDTPAILH
jgi:hypothetical protein